MGSILYECSTGYQLKKFLLSFSFLSDLEDLSSYTSSTGFWI